MKCLDELIAVKRRYTRSINLERDLEIPSAVEGYIPTSLAVDVLERIVTAQQAPQAVRAWTLTGNYGSGKSAFAHFLSVLMGPKDNASRQECLKILRTQLDSNDSLYKRIRGAVSGEGLVRAVVTANREGVKSVLLRALEKGAMNFWANRSGPKPKVIASITRARRACDSSKIVPDKTILRLIQELAAASPEGVLIVVDELGKILEYEVSRNGAGDLYLLQQIAELAPATNQAPVLFVGLLHHSFADYASTLSDEQRNEWTKIHGRFEDVSFFESERQTVELLVDAVTQELPKALESKVLRWGRAWGKKMATIVPELSNLNGQVQDLYPLHPTAVAVLPRLCARFGQNDRTLFSFLTSEEPSSFSAYLRSTSFVEDELSLFTVADLYDYFFSSGSVAHYKSQNLQRWLEVKAVLDDASNLDGDVLRALKTIGLLNMLSVNGSLRATEELVISALVTDADDEKQRKVAQTVIAELKERGLVTWRKVADELRIWQGSDIDLTAEIQKQKQELNVGTAELLEDFYSSRPLIPHRHCYTTGTFRFFEVRFADKHTDRALLAPKDPRAIGVVLYWVDQEPLGTFADGTKTPLIVLVPHNASGLREAAKEHAALRKLGYVLPEIQKDGVVRRELGERYKIAAADLRNKIRTTFSFRSSKISVTHASEERTFSSDRAFKDYLSEISDSVFSSAPIIRNELINRAELSGQGSQARRVLIEAMINNQGKADLGLSGNGPEVSVYDSLLKRTGIYRKRNGTWCFGKPTSDSGVLEFWNGIESFCLQAKDDARTFGELYEVLTAPPFGAPKGPLPLLVVAVLLSRTDDLGFYAEGSFVPALSPEHFELFVRSPELFSVKHFALSGVKAKVFKELETVLESDTQQLPDGIRNQKFLGVIKPLISFARTLNRYALQTKSISNNAQRVRTAISKSRQLDVLVFSDLPLACGFDAFDIEKKGASSKAKEFGDELSRCLRELQGAYDDLMHRVELVVRRVIDEDKSLVEVRKQLAKRAEPLANLCTEPQLTGFVSAVAGANKSNREWLEAVAMVIMDKPAEGWTDTDAERFDSAMVDTYRRFANLEAICSNGEQIPAADSTGRRLTITRHNGDEIHQMIWSNAADEARADKLISDILVHKDLKNDDNLRRVLVARLSEHVFRSES